MEEDNAKAKLRLALSVMSGSVKPEDVAPYQWEVLLGLGYHTPTPDDVIKRCEEIVFDAIDRGK
jgi:hypothetical protein